LVHLINDKSLPLASLKVIEYAEMDKVKLKFLKEVLCGILLQDDEDNIQEIFFKTASSENLTLFRESLRLFMGHFLLQKNVITSDGEDVGCDIDSEQMGILKDRIKIAENAMSLGRSRVQL
jgi:nucleolar MIF4G domain-containing protein 1